MKLRAVTIPPIAMTTLLVAGACSTTTESSNPAPQVSSSPSSSPTGSAAPSATKSAGAHITYSEFEKDPSSYADSNVVLHFSAPWCPTCQETKFTGSITAEEIIASLA